MVYVNIPCGLVPLEKLIVGVYYCSHNLNYAPKSEEVGHAHVSAYVLY